MKKRMSIQLFVAGLCLWLGTVQAAESLSTLLQKGIYAEETEGNLDDAIAIYRKIAAEAEANRTVAARANYRLGVCLLKKGQKDEAEVTFRGILKRFAGETDLVTKARNQLEEMGTPASSVVIRQVWSLPADFEASTVSPDGKWLAFTASGNLVLRDLSTGHMRHLTNADTSLGFSDTYQFSPDSRRLVYNWYDIKQDSDDLRIVSLDHPKHPEIVPYSQEEWIYPEAWSPDGKKIAAVAWKKAGADRYRLVLFTLSSGRMRVLRSCGANSPEIAGFSADNRLLIYSLATSDSKNHDIFALDIATGKESPWLVHPADDVALGWTPDRSALILKSDRRGKEDLWLLHLRHGKPSGAPALLKANFEDSRFLGLTSAGSLYYEISLRTSGHYTVSIDWATGKLLAPPKPLQRRHSDTSEWSSPSPDGRFIAYYNRSSDVPPVSIYDRQSGKGTRIPQRASFPRRGQSHVVGARTHRSVGW